MNPQLFNVEIEGDRVTVPSRLKSGAAGPQGPRSRPRGRHASPCLNLRQIRFFSNCMFKPSPRISFVSTSKLAGVPASSVFSPLTIDS